MSESEEIRELRKEIDELRQAINETTRATNYLANYLAEQSKLIAEHWYRFILWMRPFQLSVYQKPAPIRRLYRRDPAPMLPPEDCNGSPASRRVRDPKEDWEHPAKVFLPNTAWSGAKR